MSNATLNRICTDEEDPMMHVTLQCKHKELLPLQISWSLKNPGRHYWSCPFYGKWSCNFFRWRDAEIDVRSKFVIPRLANKIKELEAELAYYENMKCDMMEMTDCLETGMKEKKKKNASFNWKVILCVAAAVLVTCINSLVKNGHCKCGHLQLP